MNREKQLEPFLYDTTHSKRGVAVVINDSTDRSGSEKDVEAVKKTLARLLFDVRVFENKKDSELRDELRKIAEEDHSDSDCLVVVAMGHGGNDKIIIQGYPMSIDDLWQGFIGNNCPSLKGKPKLIFIQSCRGGDHDVGTGLIAIEASPTHTSPVNITIPLYADLLVMYSSYKKYVSHRDKQDGSWFIQSLCDVLRKDIAKKELLSLLTAVSHQVSRYPNEPVYGGGMEIPSINSMLMKEFYFVPK